MRTEKEVRAEMAPLQEDLQVLVNELILIIEIKREAKFDELFAEGITLERILSADWLELESSKIYPRVSKWIKENLPPGTSRGGYVPGAGNQLSFRVTFYQNKPLEDQQGIREVIPHVRTMGGGAWKCISIFESSLSAAGSFSLRIDEQASRYVVTCNHQGAEDPPRNAIRAEFDNLDQVLVWIWENKPYEWLKSGDDDDDYDY